MNEQFVTMPQGAKPIKVAHQTGAGIFVWAIVDPVAPPVERKIVMHGTRLRVFRPDLPHIGTVFDKADLFVWHFFDAGEM